MKMPFVALCLFGMERITKFELARIGAEEIRAEDGRVFFTGDEATMLRANRTLSVAERIGIVLGQFKAKRFEDLFQGTLNAPLEHYIGPEDAFPVKGSSLSSQLSSVPACQSIIKKAAAKRLGSVYKTEWLPESGIRCQLSFTLLRDECLLLLDTTGESLYKRGYRPESGLAPIRETLAAGIADIGGVRADSIVFDPMCGAGTLLIEAGLRARGKAPGAGRNFLCESFSFVKKNLAKQIAEEAKNQSRPSAFRAVGSDVDPAMVVLARKNIARAGLSDCIEVHVADVKNFPATEERGIMLCNPPYGDRLLDEKACTEIYGHLGRAFAACPNLSAAIITPAEGFEQAFGRKADKKRKLYNGMKPCTLYLFDSARK